MITTISFTTYSDKTKFAEKSLYEISKWKNERYQLLVACHDASKKMKNLLNEYKIKKIIDDLFYTPSNFGHLKGVNLCLKKSKGRYFFNINHDILVKNKKVIDDCENLLKEDKNGMIGWFWIGKGCYWENENLNLTIRNKKIESNMIYDDPYELTKAMEKNNIKNVAPNECWAWCCNTSFFGIKTKLFRSLGGFNHKDFKHGYADDYLTYQILEKKLNVLDMPTHLYNEKYFDSMTRCKWHDLGIKLNKNTNIYLNKFI